MNDFSAFNKICSIFNNKILINSNNKLYSDIYKINKLLLNNITKDELLNHQDFIKSSISILIISKYDTDIIKNKVYK